MNGGKTRSVKTLSGGQTFQAALSLALALADNIQQITASNQNFFFLDEGFGSLDKESLAVVFDTLKSLRRETRMVGIISHVEEMQQEIEVHLRMSIRRTRQCDPGKLTTYFLKTYLYLPQQKFPRHCPENNTTPYGHLRIQRVFAFPARIRPSFFTSASNASARTLTKAPCCFLHCVFSPFSLITFRPESVRLQVDTYNFSS
jgi:energy-coupling factor transporter ATP-binding protein EcfA2